MTSYAETVSAARRLAMLLALYFAPGYALPRDVLRDEVNRTGYLAGTDLLAQECAWLSEMGLVELQHPDVVLLTARGEDVALGRSAAPGVRRPPPGGAHGA